MLRTVDQAIIKVLQEVYNKVWDYTGLTKGVIKTFIQSMFLLIVFLYSDFNMFTLLIVAIGLYTIYTQIKSHDDQVKGRFAKINKRAEEEQTEPFWLWFRLPATFFCFTFLISVCNRLDIQILCLFFAAMSSMLLFFYMDCLYVRDREPPRKYNHAFGAV